MNQRTEHTILKLNNPIYFVPGYCGPVKVQICRIDKDTAFVKPYSRKKDFATYPIPLKYVADSPEQAKRYGRAWEHWKRKEKRK